MGCNDWTVLHHAAWGGLAEACLAILDRPDFTRANHHDSKGLTALHCASCGGHLNAVRVLLGSERFTEIDSASAEMDRAWFGWSARDIAERHGFSVIVQAIDE